MYFVTMTRPEYVLFCLTPSERAAVGLTEKQVVRLLVRQRIGDEWTLLREWSASDYSHTDFLGSLHDVSEPSDPRTLLDYLPEAIRQK